MYEYKHGCNFMHGNLREATFAKAYPMLLRKAGYFTGFAGKIGFSIDGRKFDDWGDLFDVWGGGRGQTKYTTARNPAIAKYAKTYPHSSRAYAAWADDFFKAAKEVGQTVLHVDQLQGTPPALHTRSGLRRRLQRRPLPEARQLRR